MAIKDGLLPEYDHEMATTRRLLERVPDADLGWKPHERSMALGELAGHIANLPNWGVTTIGTQVFDLASLGENARIVAPASTSDLLHRFDTSAAAARAAIAGCGDAEMLAPWTLKKDGQEMFTLPRIAALRSFVMNHIIHHRGQLSVYLRLRNVPLPSIYGPTADEAW
jgi:uncharacterized damage-inducible protein DinB